VLVDILEGVQIAGLLMLDDTDLRKGNIVREGK